MKHALFLGFLLAASLFAWQGHDNLAGYPTIAFDHPAIRYMDADPNDPVSRFNAKLAKGSAKLDYQTGLGYLPSLLKALEISPESQMLVYSKTSFQPTKISPRKPHSG